MTRIQKIKKHFADNSENYTTALIVTGAAAFVSAYAYVTYKVIEVEENEMRRIEKYKKDEWDKGRVVVQLIDGTLMSVKPGE